MFAPVAATGAIAALAIAQGTTNAHVSVPASIADEANATAAQVAGRVVPATITAGVDASDTATAASAAEAASAFEASAGVEMSASVFSRAQKIEAVRAGGAGVALASTTGGLTAEANAASVQTGTQGPLGETAVGGVLASDTASASAAAAAILETIAAAGDAVFAATGGGDVAWASAVLVASEYAGSAAAFAIRSEAAVADLSFGGVTVAAGLLQGDVSATDEMSGVLPYLAVETTDAVGVSDVIDVVTFVPGEVSDAVLAEMTLLATARFGPDFIGNVIVEIGSFEGVSPEDLYFIGRIV